MTASERAGRAAAADGLCTAAYAACEGPDLGVAMVAVGGYGRSELAPHSDLDVVLIHDDHVDLGKLADKLWYPLWDAGTNLDHSVRSVSQTMSVAGGDLRVALGQLDMRHLAGDPNLTLRVRTTMLTAWRRSARERLAELRGMVGTRHDLMGEMAHAAVPDLKEAEGGLRDATVLKALVATWLVDVPHVELERCRQSLLDVRDVLHDVAGRSTDRIAPELWDQLAAPMGVDDAPAVQAHVRELGRRITHISRLTWRRVGAVLERPTSVSRSAQAVPDHRRARGRGVGCGGRPGRPGQARDRPAAAAPRGGRGRRARCRAVTGHRRPAGARVPGAADAVAGRRPPAAGAAARGGPRPPRRLGDARGDRRAGPDPARVGTDQDAPARERDPPLHRRPPRRRDLHRGIRADPRGGPSRRPDGRGAAARHRQGWARLPQRRGPADRPRHRDPDGVRSRRGRPDRAAGPMASAPGRDRDHARPRRPGHRRARHGRGHLAGGALAAVGADRRRRQGHLGQGVVDLASDAGAAAGAALPGRPGRRRRRVVRTPAAEAEVAIPERYDGTRPPSRSRSSRDPRARG